MARKTSHATATVNRRVGKATRAHPSLTERSFDIFQVPSPIGWKHALRHVTMKAAVGPVRNAADVSVLHRIEVNVINMPLEIRVVTDCMLPVSALPNFLFRA